MFSIADNGPGIPEHYTMENYTAPGLRLVRTLTKQHHGTVTVDRTKGMKFVFMVPKPEKPAGAGAYEQ